MRLIRQLIQKSLELNEEFELNKRYIKSICYFYHAFQIAVNVTGLEDKEMKKKNRLFEKFLREYANGRFDSTIYNKLRMYMSRDIAVISNAFEVLSAEQETEGYMGDLDREDSYRIGILSLDFPYE